MTVLTQYEDESTGEDLLYINGSNFSAGLVMDDGDGLFFRLNIAYAGSQQVEDWESVAETTLVVELDSSTVIGLTSSWRFYENDRLGAFTLRGEINNLFDEEYPYIKGDHSSSPRRLR